MLSPHVLIFWAGSPVSETAERRGVRPGGFCLACKHHHPHHHLQHPHPGDLPAFGTPDCCNVEFGRELGGVRFVSFQTQVVRGRGFV